MSCRNKFADWKWIKSNPTYWNGRWDCLYYLSAAISSSILACAFLKASITTA